MWEEIQRHHEMTFRFNPRRYREGFPSYSQPQPIASDQDLQNLQSLQNQQKSTRGSSAQS
jgi:hypothetical protein